ncbi:MAG TPA: CDP-diacylglycerol--glycerol-3-phosphate 3-phosphatidyltransferase [Planctomycetota bacterium]|nr:CDP-diacylglycerol--glycerol-3-phosphate 3-phosphatidyltransferase [Planctomycetota bacterium]
MAAPRSQALANVPNALTVLRLFLCVAFFGILVYCTQVLRTPVDATGELSWTRLGKSMPDIYRAHEDLRANGNALTLLFNVAFGIFLLAAATDTLDGQIARRYGLETDFGRIADPFVDKIMILGAMTLLMPLTVEMRGWIVVLLLARELLVSGLRGFAESRGVAFPASFWGKTKMVSQTACVAAGCLYVGRPDSQSWLWVFRALLWWTILATVISGGHYLYHAKALLFPGAAKAAPAAPSAAAAEATGRA